MTYTKEIHSITSSILDETSDGSELAKALDEYARLCSRITGIDLDPTFDAWAEDSFLENGVAINPQAAAYCIKDYQRSVIFIRAVYTALYELLDRKQEQSINILYAGCGPFATLLLPLLHLFNEQKLVVNLLDIHDQSLKCVQLLIDQFGLNRFDINLVQSDACQYRHTCSLDLIISETMQKALEQEPQVAISQNLALQLSSSGIFIPEEIEVRLSLIKDSTEYLLKKLLTLKPMEYQLNEETSLHLDFREGRAKVMLGEISIPELGQLYTFSPFLLTRIKVFNNHTLDDYESNITLPCRCFDMEPLVEGQKFSVNYEIGSYPRINVFKVG